MSLLVFAVGGALLAALARWWCPRLGWASAGGYWLAAGAFFGASLVSGAVQVPADVVYAQGPWREMVQGPVVPANPLLTDPPTQMLPWRALVRDRLGRFEAPLWSNEMGAGQPLLGNAQSAAFSPLGLVTMALPPVRALPVMAALKLFLSLLLMHALMLELGAGAAGAAFGAVAFSFSVFSICWALYPLGMAVAWLPGIFLGMLRLRRGGRGGGAGLVACALGASLSGHPETLAHAALAAGVVAIVLFAGSEGVPRWRFAGSLALAAAITGGLAAPALLPFVEAVPESMRTEMVAGSAERVQPPALGARGLQVLVDPLAFGSPRDGLYDGPWNYSELCSGYAGLLALALAVAAAVMLRGRALALLARRRRRRRGGFRRCRRCSTWCGPCPCWTARPTAGCACSGCSAWRPPAGSGLDQLVARRAVRFGAAAAIGAALVALLADPPPALPWERAWWLATLISGGLIAAAFLWLGLRAPAGAAAPRGVAWLAVGALALDLVLLNVRYNPVLPERFDLAAPPAVALLRREQRQETGAPFRVIASGYDLTPNLAAFYGLWDPRANDPMQPARATLVLRLKIRPQEMVQDHRAYAAPFLSYLGVRYMLTGHGEQLTAPWQRAWEGRGGALWRNPEALPLLFMPRAWRPARDARDALAATLANPDFAAGAVAEELPETGPGSGSRVGGARGAMAGPGGGGGAGGPLRQRDGGGGGEPGRRPGGVFGQLERRLAAAPGWRGGAAPLRQLGLPRLPGAAGPASRRPRLPSRGLDVGAPSLRLHLRSAAAGLRPARGAPQCGAAGGGGGGALTRARAFSSTSSRPAARPWRVGAAGTVGWTARPAGGASEAGRVAVQTRVRPPGNGALSTVPVAPAVGAPTTSPRRKAATVARKLSASPMSRGPLEERQAAADERRLRLDVHGGGCVGDRLAVGAAPMRHLLAPGIGGQEDQVCEEAFGRPHVAAQVEDDAGGLGEPRQRGGEVGVGDARQVDHQDSRLRLAQRIAAGKGMLRVARRDAVIEGDLAPRRSPAPGAAGGSVSRTGLDLQAQGLAGGAQEELGQGPPTPPLGRRRRHLGRGLSHGGFGRFAGDAEYRVAWMEVAGAGRGNLGDRQPAVDLVPADGEHAVARVAGRRQDGLAVAGRGDHPPQGGEQGCGAAAGGGVAQGRGESLLPGPVAGRQAGVEVLEHVPGEHDGGQTGAAVGGRQGRGQRHAGRQVGGGARQGAVVVGIERQGQQARGAAAQVGGKRLARIEAVARRLAGTAALAGAGKQGGAFGGAEAGMAPPDLAQCLGGRAGGHAQVGRGWRRAAGRKDAQGGRDGGEQAGQGDGQALAVGRRRGGRRHGAGRGVEGCHRRGGETAPVGGGGLVARMEVAHVADQTGQGDEVCQVPAGERPRRRHARRKPDPMP